MRDEPPQGLDRWASWLLRQPHLTAPGPHPVRDRVLDGTKLAVGQRVLDVGAGTGWLTLEARRRVGPSGSVVALDRSHDVLAACRRFVEADDGEGAPVRYVVGDARCLPFPDGSFDAVALRSVLIYVLDKETAVRELWRALRPGGRLSLFEPINRVSAEGWERAWEPELAALRADDAKVQRYLRAHSEHYEPMVGFDERDLVRQCVAAGFQTVDLGYEYHYDAGTSRDPALVAANLRFAGNPTAPSYEEGARAVLGDAAEEHVVQVAQLFAARPSPQANAVAYLTAQR
jgi:ubiquinone/menaquinone biosynthesis C-methylase UbiE